jgi:hypothetical protein
VDDDSNEETANGRSISKRNTPSRGEIGQSDNVDINPVTGEPVRQMFKHVVGIIGSDKK